MLNVLQQPDPELARPRDGYPALAYWIARDPDNETFIFRKFNRLAARNILHLQAQRSNEDLDTRQSLRRWETLVEHAEEAGRPEKKLLLKLSDLKTLLKEYCMYTLSCQVTPG
jgi:16S rRNA U1498 N3-methylase RsmE